MLVGTTASAAERTFLRTHTRHASRLRVIHRDDGVEVEGEVDSFYRKQLLLRDAAAVWGLSMVRSSVTVRRPIPGSQTERPAVGQRPKVLLAAADPVTLARCGGELRCQGFDVTAADTGLGCLGDLRTGGFLALVLVGDLLWGGSDGVLEVASAAGYLDRMRVIYVGDRVRLKELSQATGRLTHVEVTTSRVEESVLRALLDLDDGKWLAAPVKSLPPAELSSPR